jgi:hypothetical protein
MASNACAGGRLQRSYCEGLVIGASLAHEAITRLQVSGCRPNSEDGAIASIVAQIVEVLAAALGRCQQGSPAPLADFDQLVEGPWPISTSCPPGGLCCWASAFWREIWSKRC